MKIKVQLLFVMTILAVSLLCSCKEENGIYINDNDAGYFTITNMRTNKVLSTRKANDTLVAHNGDTIKIVFNTHYMGYSFTTKLTFPDGKEKEGQDSSLTYVIEDFEKGSYDIAVSASINNSHIGDKISAESKFTLKIVSFANIEYMLTYPKMLLKRAIPVFTYTGNDGKSVIVPIPETEWVENDRSNDMQWTYQVHYDDFSIINDEVSVTYDVVDDPNVAAISTMTELRAVVEIGYGSGNIDQQNYLNSAEIFYMREDNTFLPLSEILNNHHNYLGIHIDDDKGVCLQK